MKQTAAAIVRFYLDGFRRMRLGRILWGIILLKLFILFAVIKPFFMPDYLDERCDGVQEKAAYVLDRLTGAVTESASGFHGETKEITRR